MINWQVMLCDAQSGEDVVQLTEVTGLSFSVSLDEPSSINFSIPTASPESSLLVAMARDIKLYCNGVVLFRGRTMNPRRSFGDDASSLSMSAYSYKELLRRKYLEPTDTAVTTGFAPGTDAAAIAAALIDGFQAKTNNTLGIVTNQYVTSGYSSATIRTFTPGMSIYDAINSVASSNSGSSSNERIEWDVNPIGNNVVFEMYSSAAGAVRGRSEPVFIAEIGSTVLSGTESQDTSRFTNMVFALGNSVTEIQQLSATGATSGAFQLSYLGYFTPSVGAAGQLFYNATAASVEFVLNKLPSINGQVSVSGGPLNVAPLLITFNSDLGNTDVSMISITGTATVAGLTISQYQKGGPFFAAVGHTGDAADYTNSPYGRWESVSNDSSLQDQTAVNERAYYLASVFANFIPSYDLVIEPDHWLGPNTLWVGDYLNLNLVQEGWTAARSDLRMTSMAFSIGTNGEFSLSVSVELPIPADLSLVNLAGRVRIAENMWKVYANEIARLETLADTDNNRTAQETANIEAAQKARDAFQRQFAGYTFTG